MDYSTPGLPVHHQLLELMQTNVHWVGDAIQPSHPLSSPSPLPSIFPSIRVFSNEVAVCIRWQKYWISASASVLPMNTQDWSPLGWTSWISLQSKGLSRVFSNTTVQKCQSFSTQPSFHCPALAIYSVFKYSCSVNSRTMMVNYRKDSHSENCVQRTHASVCDEFTSGGQSIGVSASTSVLPMNTQDWSPLGWTDWLSLQSKGLSRVFSNTTVQKHQFFSPQLSLSPTLTSIHDYWKNHSLD